MTLHGYLPPVCEDGSLLLDGGYTAIIPNEGLMEEIQPRAIIAVDVSHEDVSSRLRVILTLSVTLITFSHPLSLIFVFNSPILRFCQTRRQIIMSMVTT